MMPTPQLRATLGTKARHHSSCRCKRHRPAPGQMLLQADGRVQDGARQARGRGAAEGAGAREATNTVLGTVPTERDGPAFTRHLPLITISYILLWSFIGCLGPPKAYTPGTTLVPLKSLTPFCTPHTSFTHGTLPTEFWTILLCFSAHGTCHSCCLEHRWRFQQLSKLRPRVVVLSQTTTTSSNLYFNLNPSATVFECPPRAVYPTFLCRAENRRPHRDVGLLDPTSVNTCGRIDNSLQLFGESSSGAHNAPNSILAPDAVCVLCASRASHRR